MTELNIPQEESVAENIGKTVDLQTLIKTKFQYKLPNPKFVERLKSEVIGQEVA